MQYFIWLSVRIVNRIRPPANCALAFLFRFHHDLHELNLLTFVHQRFGRYQRFAQGANMTSTLPSGIQIYPRIFVSTNDADFYLPHAPHQTLTPASLRRAVCAHEC